MISGLLKFIWEAKEWLFSGLGLAFILGSLKYFQKIWPAKMPISYSYTRAFGALQVPQFLRGMYSEYPNFGMQFLPTDTIQRFWDSWPHKHCRLVETEAYRELFDNEQGHYLSAQELLKNVALEDPASADFFTTVIDYELIEQNIPDIEWDVQIPFSEYQIYRKIVPGNYTTSEVYDAIVHASDQVGFLLLFMKNESDKALNNITLTYHRHEHSHPLEQAIKSDELKLKVKKTMIIKHLQAREEILMLLEVYRKDQNGYPQAYLSSVDWPEKLTGRSFRPFTFSAPNRDKAAKIPFPFGWSGQ
jgi:hypothetical protein